MAAVFSVEAAPKPWGVAGGLVSYPNGAVVPYDPANQAATAAHLATTGQLGYAPYTHLGYGHYIGKRAAEAEADADAVHLVSYANGAVVPYNPALHGGYLGYGHLGYGYGVYHG